MKRPPIDTPPHVDPATDEIRRKHGAAIKDLQNRPATGLIVVGTITLADGAETPIKHGLGRAPAFVLVSPPRGAATAGLVQEMRSGKVDRSTVLVLKATGYGASIVVEVAVL